ncbi:MAG: hypothetical protein AAF236_08835 [Verrucomicrobiota bacterium]
MTTSDLREALNMSLPFVIKMADGEKYPVPHTDFVAFADRSRWVALFTDDGRLHHLPRHQISGLSWESAESVDTES